MTENKNSDLIKAREFYEENFPGKPFGDKIFIKNNKIFILPYCMPQINVPGILRAGIYLGEFKGKRIEPAHSAFMASSPKNVKNVLELDRKSLEIKKFLHGEEIDCPENIKGYTSVAVNGMITGFGKASCGKLKNKYPKGLRTLGTAN